jgi:hypothetical protein
LKVHGFVGVLHKGDATNAGFTLLRRGRVIEENYRPSSIFGKSNDFAYQRVYGELNLDGFPVTQAKDKFDWGVAGIEEDFIVNLGQHVADYVRVARKYRKRKTVDTSAVAFEIESDLKDVPEIEHISVTQSITQPDKTQRGDQLAAEVGEDTDVEIKGNKSFEYSVTLTNGAHYDVTLVYDDTLTMENWLEVSYPEASYPGQNEHQVTCKLNTRHPFFRPFISKPDFIKTLSELCISLVLSELEAKRTASAQTHQVRPSEIRLGMNSILNNIRKANRNE